MSERLKIGLIGAGVFAGYHANKLSAHPRVAFTAVVDQSGKRAVELAKKHDVPSLSLSELLDVSDAVIIASSASSHGRLAARALKAGCHCLIEKPLATTLAAAETIIAIARSNNLTVQVGHQERMILSAIGLDKVRERPLRIEAVRHSTYSDRGTDTSVTMDLMTHDIDLCTALMGSAPISVSGEARPVQSDTPDMAYALLQYGNAVAQLSASRVEDASERWMKLTYPCGEVRIDFNAKTLTHSTDFALEENFADKHIAKNSLSAVTDIFVKAVLDGTPVLVSAEEGAIAVRTAMVIDKGDNG